MCYGEIGEIDSDHHDYHESTIPQKVIFWKLVVKIWILVVSRGQKTQRKIWKFQKSPFGRAVIPPGWSGSIQMRKIGSNTDFSPKLMFFIWKRPKNSEKTWKTHEKLRKNSGKTQKTQERPTPVYMSHNLSPVTPTGHMWSIGLSIWCFMIIWW